MSYGSAGKFVYGSHKGRSGDRYQRERKIIMLGQDDLGGMDRNEIQDMVREQGKDVIDSVRLVFSDGTSSMR